MLFKNRQDAGKKLALILKEYKGKSVIVYALPRGGVPVGYEVAKALGAPLDTVVVRKVGAPHNPEFGVGAVAPGGVLILDNQTLQALGIERKDVEKTIAEETEEMKRRIARYRSGEYTKGITADTVILVDDGLATGVTAFAALESIKKSHQPKRIIFASPICAKDTAERLREETEVICGSETENLMAIGYWYEEFDQVSDEEVVKYLENARNKGSKP